MGAHIHRRTSIKDMSTAGKRQHRAKLERQREAEKSAIKEQIRQAKRHAVAAVRVQEATKEATEQALEVERLARQKALQLLTPNTRIRMEKSTNRKVDQQAAEHVELLREELEEEEVLETETVVDYNDIQQSKVVVYSYQTVQPEANLHEIVPSSEAAADADVEPATNPVEASLVVAAGDSIDDSLTAGMQRLYEEEGENE